MTTTTIVSPNRGALAGASATAPSATRSGRNAALDSLRALAIALMVLDHAAAILWNESLSSPVRVVTRLAEPLFAVTFGTLIAEAARRRTLARLPRIALAAVLANALFYPATDHLDILATFLAVALGHLALGRHLVWLVAAGALFRWDPSRGLLDYPLAQVLPQVALGMALRRRFGWAFALVYVAATASAGRHGLVIAAWSAAAAGLVLLAHHHPRWSWPPLAWVGRNPLRIYVAQFVVLYGIASTLVPASVQGQHLARFYRTLGDAPEEVLQMVPTAPTAADPLLACLGPSLPLRRIGDLPLVPAQVADGRGWFVVDFATTLSTVDPKNLSTPVAPLPDGPDRWARFHFFGAHPGARLAPADMSIWRAGPERRAGQVGSDFLTSGTVTIDWAGGRVHFAPKGTMCANTDLLRAGLRPLSTRGYYGDTHAGQPGPDVPVVPIRVGTVEAVAQVDTGYDDNTFRHQVDVNQALFDAFAAAGTPLVRRPSRDVRRMSCNGALTRNEAYILPAGHPLELVGIDGKAVVTVPDATLYLKTAATETRACGGIAFFPGPAAQLGASIVADAKRMVIDPHQGIVWLPLEGAR